MAEQLSEEIRKALNRYYLNRADQSVMDYAAGRLKERGWNKAADLENIFAAARPDGWRVEACAGQFWFSKKLIQGTHVIEVTEETLPQGGVSNIKDTGQQFGAFSEIADALAKIGKKPAFIDARDGSVYSATNQTGASGGEDHA